MDPSYREHIEVLVARDTSEMFVSKPKLGRTSGQWSIQLDRRRSGSDGSIRFIRRETIIGKEVSQWPICKPHD